MGAQLLAELIGTFWLVLGGYLPRRSLNSHQFTGVILGVTHQRAPTGFAGVAIGLALTLIHLISIPVTNTSVNPFAQHRPGPVIAYVQQLWLFWLAPLAGVALGGLVHRAMLEREIKPPVVGRR